MISVSKQTNKRLSSPTVSAVLLECPKQHNNKKKEKCERKVMVNVRVNPSMQLEEDEKFLILDELYDTKRKDRTKILSPYVIQLTRGEPIQMFPLEFTNKVRCDNCDNIDKSSNKKNKSSNGKTFIKKYSKLKEKGQEKFEKENLKDLKKNVANITSGTKQFLNTNKIKLKQGQQKPKIITKQKLKYNNISRSLKKETQSQLQPQLKENQQIQKNQQFRKRKQLQQLQLKQQLNKLIEQQNGDTSKQLEHNFHPQHLKQNIHHTQAQAPALKEQTEKVLQQQTEDRKLLQQDQTEQKEYEKLDSHDKVVLNTEPNKKNLKAKLINKITSNNNVNSKNLVKLKIDNNKDINEKIFKELEKIEEQPILNIENEVNFVEDINKDINLEPRSCIKSNCLKTKFFNKDSSKNFKHKNNKKKRKYRKIHFYARKHRYSKNNMQKGKENLEDQKNYILADTTQNTEKSEKNFSNEKNEQNLNNKQNIENIQQLTANEQNENDFINKQNIENIDQESANEQNIENVAKSEQNLVNDQITEKIKLNLANEQNLNKQKKILSNEQKSNNELNSQKIDSQSMQEIREYGDPITSGDTSQSIHKWSQNTGKNIVNDKFKNYKNLNVDAPIKINKNNMYATNDPSNLNHKVILQNYAVENLLQNAKSRKIASITAKGTVPNKDLSLAQYTGPYRYIKGIPFIESIVRPSRKNNFHSILKYPRNFEHITHNKQLSNDHNQNYNNLKNINKNKIKPNDKKNRDTMTMFYSTNDGYYGSVNFDSRSKTANSGLDLNSPLDFENKCDKFERNDKESDNMKRNECQQGNICNNNIGVNENNNNYDNREFTEDSSKSNNNYILSDNNNYLGKDLTTNGNKNFISNSMRNRKKKKHKVYNKKPLRELNEIDQVMENNLSSLDQELENRIQITESSPRKCPRPFNSYDKSNSQENIKPKIGESDSNSNDESGKLPYGFGVSFNTYDNSNIPKNKSKVSESYNSNILENESSEKKFGKSSNNGSTGSRTSCVIVNLNKNQPTCDNLNRLENEQTENGEFYNDYTYTGADEKSSLVNQDEDLLTQQENSNDNSNTLENEQIETEEYDNNVGSLNTQQNEPNKIENSNKLDTSNDKELNGMGIGSSSRSNLIDNNLKKANSPVLIQNARTISMINTHNKLKESKQKQPNKNNSKLMLHSNKKSSNKFLAKNNYNKNDKEININSRILDDTLLNEEDYFDPSNADNEFNRREATYDDYNANNIIKANNFHYYLLEPENNNAQNLRNTLPVTDKIMISSPNEYSELQGEKENDFVANENGKLDRKSDYKTNKNLNNHLNYKNDERSDIFSVIDNKNLRTDDKMNLLNSLQNNDITDQELLSNEDINSNFYVDWSQVNRLHSPVSVGRKKKQNYLLSKDLNTDSNNNNDFENLNSPLELQSTNDVNSNMNTRSCTVCGGKNSPITKLDDDTYICDICARQTKQDNSNNVEGICEMCGGKVGIENKCLCTRKIRDLENMNEIPTSDLENLYENFKETNINDNNLEQNNLDDMNLENDIINDQELIHDRSKRSLSNLRFSVYNMTVPIQFITTKIQIYRKRHNSWCKIQPSITLTSLSTIFANDDLSIILSSHIDIFKPDKPFKILENHKLLVPEYNMKNETLEINNNLIAIDGNKFNLNTMNENDNMNSIREVCDIASLYQNNNNREYRHINNDVINLGDFGYFPSHMNVLEKCPNDNTHLCLNMVDEEVPAYSVKMQFPFRQNDLVPEDISKIRIIDIMTDATTWGILQVTLIIINEGLVTHDFIIDIKSNGIICPSVASFVTKTLMPHISETITFLLPLEKNKPKQYKSVVVIKSVKNETVVKRDMIINPTLRCFCIWKYNCQCIANLASPVETNIWHILSKRENGDAGFYDTLSCLVEFTLWELIIIIVVFLIILALLLGLIKALWGLKSEKVNKWGYDYIQSMHRYVYATRIRRFLINVLFFLVIPFIYLCKCFIPNEEDELLENTSKWGLTIKTQPLDGYDTDNDNDNYRKYGGGTEDDDDDDESTILSQHIEKFPDKRSNLRTNCNIFDSTHDENDSDGNDLNNLIQCNQMIKEMSAEHSSEEINEVDTEAFEAFKLIRRLIASKIVYRTLYIPVGNAVIPSNHQYSIRGYFVPSLGTGYQFFTPVPLRQYYIICPESHTLRGIVPPYIIDSRPFTRNYNNRREVLQAGDLSLRPSVDAPCINVLAQNRRMYINSTENN